MPKQSLITVGADVQILKLLSKIEKLTVNNVDLHACEFPVWAGSLVAKLT